MDLWIRTQNKHSLVKPDYITTYEIDYNTIIDRFENVSVIAIKEDEQITLGCYKTIERAIEVIDEIMNNIKGLITKNDVKEHNLKDYTGIAGCSPLTNNLIYEMPEE